MSTHERPQTSDALKLLAEGDIVLEGRLPWSSNATFVVTLCLDEASGRAVYKPYRGERELWDFPDGISQREVAAYIVSESLGWGLVPETIVRHDAPLGAGSLQRFVPADFSQHYFTLLERPEHHAALKSIAVFDIVANNADRKGGHCLLGEDGRIWAIDHGLCFHDEPKLRTVIWDFAGEPVPVELRADVAQLANAVPPELADLLYPEEIDALVARARRVAELDRFPNPSPSRRPYPWPMV